MKKYEINSENRVVALIDFDNVKTGDVGGFVESENNLSHDGLCWVYGNAQVSGNAWVSGNAQVSGNARVSGDARVCGDALVYGDARVYGDAVVSGDARVSGDCSKTPTVISGLKYPITITDSDLKAGCQFHSLDYWKSVKDIQLRAMDGDDAVEFYHNTLKPLIELLKL